MKTFKYFILIITILSFWACEDMSFIEEKPESDYLLTDLNENVLESLVIGVYEPMTRSRGRLWESFFATCQEHMAEYATSNIDDIANFGRFATYQFSNLDQSYLQAMWTTFYEAIGRANFLIKAVEESTDLNAAIANRAKAEALFVRATCYYHMVRTWGEIPLRLKPVTDANNTGQPKAKIDEIYAQIIEDFKFAEQHLPNTVIAAKSGRATKGAAMTSLADVYLTRKDFTNARSKAKEVIDNKTAFGYNLEPSLQVLYSPTAVTNPEEVFALKFTQVRAQGNFLLAYAHDPRAKEAGLAARGLNRFITFKTVPLIRDWDGKDVRKGLNLYDSVTVSGRRFPVNLRGSKGDFLFGKYKDPGAPDETASGNDFYLYRYADVLLIFAEAENQLNGATTAAYDAINQVRRRGYGVSVNTSSAVADLPTGLSKEAFDELVFRERGYEFFFEAKRWYDLKRTGRWQKFVTESGIKAAPTQGEYWAIPNVEIANNPAIK